jgi:hypothetical protein
MPVHRIGLALLLATSPATAGPCKYHHDRGFVPDVLTPDGTTLDQNGGAVVAAVSVMLDRATLDDPTPQDWRFDAGDHAVGKRTVIAPGLVVVRPTATAADLEFENPDRSPVRKLHYRESKTAATLAAPKIDSVTFRDKDLGIMLREITIAKLSAAPPAGVVALVVYAGDKPRSWAAISDAKTDITIYAVDDCVQDIPGTVATRAGDRITLAWLDAAGRLSARTSAITVAR